MIKKTLEKLEERKPNQTERIINALRDGGINGTTTDVLSKISLRYGSRLSELYTKGYKIETVPIDESQIIFKYILLAEPIIKIKKKTGKELVMDEIKNYGNLISDLELEKILKKTDCIISRKSSRVRND